MTARSASLVLAWRLRGEFYELKKTYYEAILYTHADFFVVMEVEKVGLLDRARDHGGYVVHYEWFMEYHGIEPLNIRRPLNLVDLHDFLAEGKI